MENEEANYAIMTSSEPHGCQIGMKIPAQRPPKTSREVAQRIVCPIVSDHTKTI